MQSDLAAQLIQIEHIWHSQPEAARLACLELITQAREMRQPYYQICAAELYGKIMDHEGRAFEARNVLYEAVQQAQALHDFILEARIYEQIARLHYTKGEYRTALQNWLTCIELAESDAKTWMQAKVGVGQIYDALDDPQAAIQFHQAAAARINEVNDPYLEAKIYINLGVNLLRCHRNSEARQILERARDLCLIHHFPDYAAESYYRLGEIALDEGDLNLAMHLLDNALKLAQQVAYQWGLANIYSAMAKIHARQEHWQQALDVIHEGQRIALENDFSHILMRLHLAAASYAEALFNMPLALAELKAGFEFQQQLNNSSQPEQRAELEQKTGLRLSVGSMLINLANHPAIEQGKPDEFCPEITQAATRILNLDRVGLWLCEADQLRCLSMYCRESGQFIHEAPILASAAPVFMRLISRHKSLIAHDALHHPDAWDLAEYYLQPRQIQSILAFPVHSSNQHYVLMFEHRGEQRNWIPDDIQHASQIADIAVRAMTNQERRQFQHEIHELNVRLIESNEALESRVQERTKALAQSNQELHLAMDKLVQSEKLAALGSLVAGIAHELNTPLGAALTCSSALSTSSLELDQQLQSNTLKKSTLESYISNNLDASQLIERNIRRASDLVSHFKQVAVDTDSTRRREFDLAELIDEVLLMLHPQLKHTQHRVQNQIPTGVLFNSYPGPLEQIFSNFILNSVLHGFESLPSGQITISLAEHAPDYCRIVYQDNGCGISSELQKRVFDPFFTTKLGKGGSGLGLYIAYNLATGVLGGELYLDSEPGQFTRFTLHLPLLAPNIQQPDLSKPSI
ncbi:ATP-binding protein [Chitinibacter sp. GC72]|uniref:ATP-binding protein n=1 Tax=Chitinibacter sp. GC72 TaxID=1526917 RepID=UPI0012FB764D|nr:ATP-binding protein [Chitinibacter sp. GC72]